MKILSWVLGVLMVVAVAYFGVQIVASETGEVVVLHTDPDGANLTTRLWVVDHDGDPWLRSGGGAVTGWYERLLANPLVTLERDGATRYYLALPEPEAVAEINALMRDKYGWRDDVVAVLAGARDGAVAVRLTPAGD